MNPGYSVWMMLVRYPGRAGKSWPSASEDRRCDQGELPNYCKQRCLGRIIRERLRACLSSPACDWPLDDAVALTGSSRYVRPVLYSTPWTDNSISVQPHLTQLCGCLTERMPARAYLNCVSGNRRSVFWQWHRKKMAALLTIM